MEERKEYGVDNQQNISPRRAHGKPLEMLCHLPHAEYLPFSLCHGRWMVEGGGKEVANPSEVKYWILDQSGWIGKLFRQFGGCEKGADVLVSSRHLKFFVWQNFVPRHSNTNALESSKFVGFCHNMPRPSLASSLPSAQKRTGPLPLTQLNLFQTLHPHCLIFS